MPSSYSPGSLARPIFADSTMLLRLAHFRQQCRRPVHLPQGLADDGRMDSNGPVLGGVEPIVAGNRVNVAVEHEADDATLRVDQGAAGISPHDVAGRRYAEGRAHVELALDLHPAVGNLEWRDAGRSVECTLEVGERFHLRTVLLPTLHAAVIQAQREVGIGGDLISIDLEAVRRTAFPGG